MKQIFLPFTLLLAQTLIAGLTWAEVDINSATAKELADELYGVGKRKAKAIVKYREENNGFVAIEELTEVKGIGKRLLRRNRDVIVLGEYGTDDMADEETGEVTDEEAELDSEESSEQDSDVSADDMDSEEESM